MALEPDRDSIIGMNTPLTKVCQIIQKSKDTDCDLNAKNICVCQVCLQAIFEFVCSDSEQKFQSSRFNNIWQCNFWFKENLAITSKWIYESPEPINPAIHNYEENIIWHLFIL